MDEPHTLLQVERRAAAALVTCAGGEVSGEGAGGSAGAAEPAARSSAEAALEPHLGPGPALRGPRHQG